MTEPMRIRYFELPSEQDGDRYTTPFLLVFDRCPRAEIAAIVERIPDLKAITGARGVLAFPYEVELG